MRLVASLASLAFLTVAIGLAASHLAPDGNSYARVSPASGFWLLLFASALYVADSLVRLEVRSLLRLALLVAAALFLALLLSSGLWDDISFMKEYRSRADSFWNEAQRHIALALGSLVAATVAGIPLGLLCHRLPRLRALVLNSLNIVQTIPSMALFGILIAPLGWLAAQFPLAASLGIRGIGAAPAFVALFLYSLLPIVANTVAGLAQVPDRDRRRARHGHDAAATAVQDRVSAGLSGHSHRHSHRHGAEYRPDHHRRADRRRRVWNIRLSGHRPDGDGSRSARRAAHRASRLCRRRHPRCRH